MRIIVNGWLRRSGIPIEEMNLLVELVGPGEFAVEGSLQVEFRVRRATEKTDVSELVDVVAADGKCKVAASGEACNGPVAAIGNGTQVRVNVGEDFLDEHLFDCSVGLRTRGPAARSLMRQCL